MIEKMLEKCPHYNGRHIHLMVNGKEYCWHIGEEIPKTGIFK